MKFRFDKLALAIGLLSLAVYVADVLLGKLTPSSGWHLLIDPVGDFLLVLFSAMGVVTCALLRERVETDERQDDRTADCVLPTSSPNDK